ncbi:hypothetical protein C8Q80DRAFT_1199847 [Daedaleopsis nitida]|nr:hypothetical protein C8Q80DRAFT_1199847 [Daedaleopsis nitida]
MKISKAFAIVEDLRLAVQAAFVPTVLAMLRSPLLIIRPHEVSRIFMSHVWKAFSDGIDQGGRPVKEELIRANAKGIVLDIGAGHGHTVLYLDRTKVTQYVALEPNALMHPQIRALAATHGFSEADGTLLVLPYGAEETALIRSALSGSGQDGDGADTLISVLTLCSVPAPERTLCALVGDVLRPGGTLLFYEHVLSPRADVAWWQRFWTPVWRLAFDGCCLDRATHVWIGKMDAWREGSVWGKEGEEEEHLFWHRTGRFVKKDAA